MSTDTKDRSIVAQGTRRKWFVPVILGLSLILIVAVVPTALSSAADSATASGIEAQLGASSTAPVAESDLPTYQAATSDPNMTPEEHYQNLLELYRSGELEYHAPGR